MIEAIVLLSIIVAILGFAITILGGPKNTLIGIMGLIVLVLGFCMLCFVPLNTVGNIDIADQIDDKQPYYVYNLTVPYNQQDQQNFVTLSVQKINSATGKFFGPIITYYTSKDALPDRFKTPEKIISKNGKIEIWNYPFQQ